jgi:inosine triphosphate pyrophosphatase
MLFATTNQNKLKEAEAILGMKLEQLNISISEIQGTPEQITLDKARKALDKARGPVIVEDTSLSFSALNGLPGPYIDEWQKRIGNEGLYRLLEGFSDKTATASCIVALAVPGKEPLLFKGEVKGEIVRPRGKPGFGWDPIFETRGKTYGEMSMEEKNQHSFRSLAFTALRNHLLKHPL